MIVTLDQYMRLTDAERRSVVEVTDGKARQHWRAPDLDEAEEYPGEAADRGLLGARLHGRYDGGPVR